MADTLNNHVQRKLGLLAIPGGGFRRFPFSPAHYAGQLTLP